MKPNTYQQLALKTGDNVKLNEYQTGAVSTAIYPGKLAYPTLGLCGEVGELADVVDCNNYDKILKEAGDVLWYAANVASDCGAELSEVCKRKTFQNSTKRTYWDSHDAVFELVVQAGIVAENVKKTIRDHDGVLQDKRRANIIKALKKLILVLAEIVNNAHGTLEKCAEMNLEKLRSRQERGKLTGDGDNR